MAGHGDGDNFEMPSLDSQSLRDDGQSQQISASAISPSSPLITRPAEPQQFIKLFFPMGWTISFTIALVIVIKVYEGKGILTPSQKNAFNFITTGLILFLGLSFYESFKNLAQALRHHLKHWFKPSSDEQRLVENFDALLKVVQLAHGAASWGLRCFCIVWLCINLVALVIAAIINLTYTVDDGYNYNGIYLQSGLVNVSDLTCYMHGAGCSSQVTVDQLAHAYGDTTLGADSKQASDCGYFTDTASVISSTENFRYYCRRNTTVQGFAYRFNEYNPLDTQKTYPRFTNRTITAFSRECNEYPQVDGPPEKTTVGNPKSLNYISAMNFTYTNGSANQSIVIPTSALGREGTTYIFRGYHVPAEAGNFAYGDRGIWMWVYRNPGVGQDQGRFYECPVTVSAVSNVLNPKHNISDGLALEAAASIALQGQWRGNIEDPNYMQWQWYASGHPWEIHGHDNSRVGANMAEHAIISLAEMVVRNQPIQTPGMVPYLAVSSLLSGSISKHCWQASLQ